jgi:hypothetical protein
MSQRQPLCEHAKVETVAAPTREIHEELDGTKHAFIVEHLRCLKCKTLFSRARPAKEKAA